jgi:high-affinity nickel permease
MLPLLSIVALGFFLGMRHATDADHVVAVTTIVSRERSIRGAALIGILWGLGLTMELSVGLMLILLGILNLTGMMNWIRANFAAGSHNHSHGDFTHTHSIQQPSCEAGEQIAPSLNWMDRTFGKLGLYQFLRPLVVGIVHGLAGSAAVALLVLTTIRVPWLAVVYLLVFGLGTVGGMALITSAIAVPFAVSDRRFSTMNRWLATASGVISVGFGLLIVYQMGIVHGLFTSHPTWKPE